MPGNRPSRTAVKIATALLYLAQDPKTAVLLPEGAPDCTRRLLAKIGLLKQWQLSFFRKPRFREYVTFAEKLTVPGIALHIGLRKRLMDDEARLAIAQGVTQVLVVGAGFDTLCMRLAAEFSGVTFVEVDHPATCEIKRTGVEALGALRPNLHLLSVELGSVSLGEALAAVDTWRRDAISVVVAEGVLMYLDESAVSSFLNGVRRNTGAGSRLLFTYLLTDEAGHIRVGKLAFLTRWSLRTLKEPLQWSIREDELQRFLEKHNYKLDTGFKQCELRRRYLAPAGLDDRPLADVEFIAIAETLS